MTMTFCSKGHENSIGNRFCSQCGDRLSAPTPGQGGDAAGISAGMILGSRYRITSELGQGGFGRTYLAEDINRFNERCVLKEFAPQVSDPNTLQKAQQLFDREASVLYKLQHPQIPKFREMYRCSVTGSDTLLLVQDYVEGETYRALLKARKVQNRQFSESEVTQLLLQLLPILEYIHFQGIIHRDISPENLILRSSDKLPVLIDFGGVKQMAVSAISRFSQQMSLQTHLGKPGYAPEEQLRLGKAYPSSDLYSLAVTVLVLLTGKEPQEFYDSSKAIWLWRREVTVSANLATVLDKMLAHKPGDRYQNAREVMQALQSAIAPYQPSNISQLHTMVVAPAPAAISPVPLPIPPRTPRQPTPRLLPILLLPLRLVWHCVRPIAVIGTSIVVLGGISAIAVPKLISLIPPLPNIPSIFTDSDPSQKIVARLESLQISEEFFNHLVNELFHSQHPELQGNDLTNQPEDASLRQQWDRLALELLGKLERANLSEEIRRQLGRYSLNDYQNWKKQANLGRLTREADEQFYELFPELRGQQLNPETLGQVWYAIAASRLDRIN